MLTKVRLLISAIVMSILLITGWAYSATFTVTNLNDSGDGSLRWAIEQANANPGADMIDFSVSGTISPISGLPWITDGGTVIDASSQWIGAWPEGQPGITLDGTAAGGGSGLGISGADNCHIRGLFITNFGVNGVYIGPGAKSNTIGGTNEGERNILSGNDWRGVQIEGSGANNNLVSGNYIGTDVNGTAALGNSGGGVGIEFGAQSNTIGGTGSGEGNTIAFNDSNGVIVNGIDNPDTDYNKISGNSIHDNAALGIKLEWGGNDEIPAPTITSAVFIINTLRIEGTGAGANATVELFEADSFESGEGKTYLGSLTADENGNFSGKINVRGKELSVGDPLTSTITHTDNNTSEFCPTVATVGGGWESIYDQMFGRADSLIALPVLRRYRDEILMNDPQGEELVCELYDEHSGELALTLITHPKLARRSSALVTQHLPGIRRVLDGKQMTMNSLQLTKVEVLLEDMAAVSSPELKEYIRSIQQILQEGHLANFGIEVRDNVEEATQIAQKPNEFRLFQNKPNPCNPDTWIPYQLSEAAEVTIRIYNVSGQLVRTLHPGTKPAGFYLTQNRAAHWDGKDSLGQSIASGMYFYNLEAGKFAATRKMLILK